MANWDDDDYDVPTTTASVPVIASKGKWEGEDEDDEDIPVHSPLDAGAKLTLFSRMNGTPSQKTRNLNRQLLHLHRSPRRV
jgi:hypothetical protein